MIGRTNCFIHAKVASLKSTMCLKKLRSIMLYSPRFSLDKLELEHTLPFSYIWIMQLLIFHCYYGATCEMTASVMQESGILHRCVCTCSFKGVVWVGWGFVWLQEYKVWRVDWGHFTSSICIFVTWCSSYIENVFPSNDEYNLQRMMETSTFYHPLFCCMLAGVLHVVDVEIVNNFNWLWVLWWMWYCM